MQHIKLKGLLQIISGNMVSEKRYQRTLRALIDNRAGTWKSVMELDQGGVLAEESNIFSPKLGPKIMNGLRLAWVPNPDDSSDSAFCAILFFYGQDGLMWHHLAIFNRDTLRTTQ